MINMPILEIPTIKLYSLDKDSKRDFFLNRLIALFNHHYNNSFEFKRMMDAMGYNKDEISDLKDFPYIPVRLFKMHNLLSVNHNEVIKTMTSSGTSGQAVSKIFLDKLTASRQTRTLSKIVSSLLGSSRVPTIIIDCESTIKNRNNFSARAAGITGFSIFASKRIFALNDDMSLNIELINNFLKENSSKTIFLFGFTFIVYQYFFQQLLKNKYKIDLSNAILIHGGGWKKLINQSVDNSTFKSNLKSVSGLTRIHDYYGMVEQTGTIYIECEAGHLHTSEYSEIFIRNPKDFSICKFGQEGIIQLISLLPLSYPGQSILTEDLGVLIGEDDCKCGRKGKYFKILSRLKNAEIRGCSDTYGGN